MVRCTVQKGIVGLQAVCLSSRLVPLLFRRQTDLECAYDTTCDVVLNREDIRHRAIKTLGPQVTTGFGINQLGINAHPISRSSNTALKYILRSEFSRDL